MQTVGWSGGGNVYALDVESGQWTGFAPAEGNLVEPGTVDTSGGVYGRFQYVPSHNVFILLNGTRAPRSPMEVSTYFYRLDTDPGAGFNEVPDAGSSSGGDDPADAGTGPVDPEPDGGAPGSPIGPDPEDDPAPGGCACSPTALTGSWPTTWLAIALLGVLARIRRRSS